MSFNNSKDIFEQIISQINSECEIKCTQQHYADTFNVSRRKMNDFLNCKNYDFELLLQYCAFHSFRIECRIFDITPFERMML